MWLDNKAKEIMIDAAEKIVTAARANVGPNTDLAKSIGYTYNDESQVLSMFMNEYGWYLDAGVTGAGKSDFKGKNKPVHKSLRGFRFKGAKEAIGGSKSIDKWMKQKGISSSEYSHKDLNFLIRRSIYQHGIKPTLFLTKPFELYISQIDQQFEAMQQDLEKYIGNK